MARASALAALSGRDGAAGPDGFGEAARSLSGTPWPWLAASSPSRTSPPAASRTRRETVAFPGRWSLVIQAPIRAYGSYRYTPAQLVHTSKDGPESGLVVLKPDSSGHAARECCPRWPGPDPLAARERETVRTLARGAYGAPATRSRARSGGRDRAADGADGPGGPRRLPA